MVPVDREGIFRADIIEYGLKEVESGSVAVAIKAKLTHYWSQPDDDWFEWSQYEQEAEGDVWIVKKNGELNQGAINSLLNFAGWNGDLKTISDQSWQPPSVAVVVKKDVYKEHVRFKISFINDYNRTPGAMSNVGPEVVDNLQAKYGSQLRAMAGDKARNGAPPAGTPPTPPQAPARPTPPAAPPAAVTKQDTIPGDNENIPF